MIETKQGIVEIRIPTFYGDELPQVNGIKYGWRVGRQTALWRLRRLQRG
jgi:hypothetical protein